MKYLLAKKLFTGALNGFYSSVKASGLEKIPTDKPLLFVSNHNNAFIDPLLLASQLDRPVTFTAKSTLARNPLLNVILKSFSVELLSRRVDRGKADSGRSFNLSALQRLQDKLHDKGAVYIFPEGKSHNDPVLHEFKTGAAKLALSYAQKCESLHQDNDLVIIPLGLVYSDKSAFRSKAGIQVGEPLSLKAWLSTNPTAGAHALTERLQTMVAETLAIEKAKARKAALAVQSPKTTTSLGDRFRLWEKRVVGAPFGALGGLLNAIPFAITALLMKLLSTDHDHPASAAVVVGPPVFAIAHCLQLLVIGLLGSGFLMMLYLLILVPGSVLGLKAFDRVFNMTERASGLQEAS